ncbi:hypothetical protein IWX83_001080 [Flavobacterium sp. CG_9.1]|uniref:hypothetical protein n=1 Tax=Flavobacterium sp. CG_9.1 TaxID=2787728 RepID=UPI0018C9185D|nr:hypothetical protein [Flavobacterium sp. CG_9.1]MBG6061303.1 hypothetical protein [Flavobacterium sp. CG_9.1]
MKCYSYILILLGFISGASGQTSEQDLIRTEIENSTDLIKPNILSNHPLGMYISRINHNFKVRSPEKYSFSFEVSSGNVMLPYVKSYTLTNPVDRANAAQFPWHDREYKFDLNTVPAQTNSFTADGVIRSYKFTFSLPLSVNHELTFGIRSYSLDGGKYPFSVFTSDESIEWFHSTIAGGEDPFSRRYYGLNKAKISYQDENNTFLTMNNGNFRIPGMEINYFYYPKLEMNKKHRIYMNFGAHFGINMSRYNPVMDIGISSSAIKKMIVKDKNILTVGISAGALRQRLFQFGDRVNFSDRSFLYSFEGLIDYKRKLQNNNTISFGINYTFQTPYNNKNDFNHIILTGERVKSHWQETLSHLYENLDAWNFICTYSVKQFSYFIYIREDLTLDNAPDLQTGFGVKMSFKN